MSEAAPRVSDERLVWLVKETADKTTDFRFGARQVDDLVLDLWDARERLRRAVFALEGLAERDCTYGDGCSTVESLRRHGPCVGCIAREALGDQWRRMATEVERGKC